MGNAYAFSGTAFGWLCPQSVSPLARHNRPLLVLLNVRRCEGLWRDLALLVFVSRRGLASCLRIAHRLPRYLYRRGPWASFLYRERSSAFLARYLARLLHRDCAFFLPGSADDRFHIAGAQCDLVIPSSTFLAPPASSPCLDANEEIGLWATESPDCLTLQLRQTNLMWGGEPSELLVAKGY